MGLFELFYKQFFGMLGIIQEEPDIIDGIPIEEAQNPMEDSVEDPDQPGLIDGFRSMLEELGRKPRTIQEYVYDLKSFGEESQLDFLRRELIEERLSEVKPATARRKLAALNQFAKWRVHSGETTLYITLAMVNH